MRHPASLNRARSMRRVQRPSQRWAAPPPCYRSADSKLTTHIADTKPTAHTDSTSYSEADRFEDHLDRRVQKRWGVPPP